MKTKTFKRLAAAVAALVMMSTMPLVGIPCVVNAASSITINSDSHGGTHSYSAYQIFTGDLSTETDGNNTVNVLSNIQWGSNVSSNSLVSALVTANGTSGSPLNGKGFTAGMTASQIAEIIKNFSDDSAEAFEFARIVNDNVTGTPKSLTIGTPENVDDGYYLVVDSASGINDAAASARILQVCGITSVNPKIDYPTLTKKIVTEKDTDSQSLIDSNTAAIGDKISYRMTSRIPDMTGYNKYYFIISDTMDAGLTFDATTVKITIDDNGNGQIDSGETTVLTKGAAEDYYVETSGGSGTATDIKIIFHDAVNKQKNNQNKAIIIDYDATLNEHASLATNKTDANKNTAKLTYSNNPNTEYKGNPGPDNNYGSSDDKPDEPASGEPTGNTADSQVVTYTTGFSILKTDGGDNSLLKDVTFTITNKDATPLKKAVLVKHTFTQDGNGTYFKQDNGTYNTTHQTDNTKYKMTEDRSTVLDSSLNDPVSISGVTSEDGILGFDGLGEGDYILTETAPTGYNSIDPIPFRIKASISGDTCTWTVCKIKNDYTDGDTITNARFDIVNNKGSVLPSTGGIGTTIFYVSGGALILGAGIVLVTKKRMSLKDDR